MTLIPLTPFQEVISRWNKKSAIPLDIPLIDEIIGGLLPCHLHIVLSDSGVGKTRFCLDAIFHLLEQESNAKVLYCDFYGNFRLINLKRLLTRSNQLDQIAIFQPNNLLEQIIFFRNLLENKEQVFDLIILDTLFGSPLTALEYFQKEPRFWKKKIFSHLLDLQSVARETKIPILLTNHLISARKNSEMEYSLNQYGGDLVEQFVPIEFFIRKTERKHHLKFRIFQNIVGSSDFTFVLHRSSHD